MHGERRRDERTGKRKGSKWSRQIDSMIIRYCSSSLMADRHTTA